MDVLGINFSNDSAAALVRDGRVVAASQEERFTRIKHDRAFPDAAISFCLKQGGVRLDDVDAVAFFWNPGAHLEPMLGKFSSAFRHHAEFLYSVPNHLLRRMDGDPVEHVAQTFTMKSGRKLEVHYYPHHVCHAAGAFFRSPFKETAVLTVDGYGERVSTMIAEASGLRVRPMLKIEFPHSLGSVYAAFTQYLGFRPNSGEGKVMGLASYGKPAYADEIRRMVHLTRDGFEVDLSYFSYYLERRRRYTDKLTALLGPERVPESPIDQRHMDIAASIQAVLEESLLHLAGLAREITTRRYLCMSGGVALNCVANGRIVRESGFDRFYFYPAASDAGSSMGAALWHTHGTAGLPRAEEPDTDLLGPSYDDQDIRREILKTGAAHARLGDPVEAAARLIASGKIIGWFQGRSEFGPRALGNRSILADARRPDMKDLLNSRVKFREPFRPYAPSVVEDRCGDFFSSGVPSPYMLRVYDTLPDKKAVLPAITHVDGTARVQTVAPSQNERYHALITAFGRLTGVPVVLNTSFNVRGEPIVNTPAEAMRCFFATGMDYLLMGEYVVARDPAHLAAVAGAK